MSTTPQPNPSSSLPNQKLKLQLKSQRSRPDTSELKDKFLQQVSLKLDEAFASLGKSLENPATKPVVPDYILEGMEANDLLLVYDVRVISKRDTEFKVVGHSVLTAITDASSIAAAPEAFQGVFYSSVWQPLRTKLFKHLQEGSMAKRVLPHLIGGLTNNGPTDIPTIPTPSHNSDMLPLGE